MAKPKDKVHAEDRYTAIERVTQANDEAPAAHRDAIAELARRLERVEQLLVDLLEAEEPEDDEAAEEAED